MKPRSLLGLILAAGAAGIGFWWYRRRAAAGTGAPLTAAAPANDLSSLQQVGSNYNLDSTPEIVKMTLDYAAKVNRGCWLQTALSDGQVTYTNSLTGKTQHVVYGSPGPTPQCGFGD